MVMTKKHFAVGVLALGWIPTLALVFGVGWGGGRPLAAATRSPMKVTRLYTGADGLTKVEEFDVPLKPRGGGTGRSEIVGGASLQFRGANQDYNLDWRVAPRRQYVVTLSGESEVELEGGRKIRLGPGHILLAEDTTGKGHISRAAGSDDRLSLFITLADGASTPR